ncbi:PREDICTED: otoferlin-like [Atta cephalotes]|uniref:C2 domain-containing protein n=1 Tax=Atta cephalotes TaxID=12957 RepID=A0A158NLV5_ATTCE|nr:PREDICTED: otoferlin-like [Atta cephalotes]
MSSLCRKTDFENINPYVQISFAGMKGTTSEAWQTYCPKFYEAIIFKEMFPVLCHRVRITIKHRIDSCRTCTVAVHILDTTKISNSGEYGFLPTYGPSFIHFYGSGSVEKNGCSGKCLTAMPLYRGRVLLSLKTEMDDPESSSGIGVETIPAFPIIEKSLWLTEEYLLVGVLYDVCLIDRSRFGSKLISFELSLGNAGNRQFSHTEIELKKRTNFESQSTPRRTGTLDGKYNYVPLGSRKPCLYVRSWWPNLEWRMNNNNNLRYISNFLETKLEKLEALIVVENPIAFEAYNETIRTLKAHCVRYLDALDTSKYESKGGTTKLDRHRISLCRKNIEDVLTRIKINGELPNNNYMRIAMIHAYYYFKKLRNLCDDPQHSLPDVFVWMIAGSKRVAYSRLSAEQIVYSEEATKMGEKCGRRINLFPRNPDDESEPVEYSACKIEAFLWLGNARYAAACWSAIPPGYEIDHGRNVDTFPKYIEYNQFSTFQLRAHIFQGHFDPGMDASGLLDLYIQVVFQGYTASTRMIRQSLDPFWDQTLIFPPIILHGSKEYTKFLPPEVVLQIFQHDLCSMREFCGKCIAVPLVKLTTETYSPPDFPPKLEWYKFQPQKDCTGSVLAAFELIELPLCVFEMEASFPQDYMLEIQVWDFDATTADDLIGVTRIDIENRFYSQHRAHCGIANVYSTTGYNVWRDREKPAQILELLCRKNNLPLPEYGEHEIKIGKQSFPFHAVIEREGEVDREECMALSVLHHWQDFPICGCALVPEHVERRPLFNVKRPGLEQGKLEMWIDMFRIEQFPPKPAVNIAPPIPEEYEVRVIVWNTEDVPLIESQFLTGEKCSDIYVKGWIQYEDYQKTDVHYNSLTGEGNFNWRFVFRITYSKGENVMIVRRRMFIFAKNEIEEKLPCKLHLQVWDSDHFSSDDFIGELTLDLSRMPRGSSNSKNCTLKLLEPQLPTINLFKVSRTKAWWPFMRDIDSGRYVQAGKIEMEIYMLKAIDADNQPAGRGRNPPQNLPPPKRPDTSFSWFRNPWRAFRFVVCRYYRWRIIYCLTCTLFVLLVACGIYAFPGYFVKRLLGA